MDSPFDAFPPEHPNAAPLRAGASGHDHDDRQDSTDLAARLPLMRIEALPTSASAPAAGAGVAYSRTFTESTVVWRNPQANVRGVSRSDWLLGIAASACVSACVSLLAMWLWGSQSQAAGPDLIDAMTVTYEPLEPRVAAPPGDALESLEPSEREQPSAAPASLERGARALPRREAAPVAVTDRAPRPADRTPARAASRNSASEAVLRSAAISRRPGFVVITEPEGAHVTINGVGYGTTPVHIEYLPPGSKRIRATKAGYQSEERFLGAQAVNSTANLRIVLREAAVSREPR
jgi:PEGA domain